MAYPTDITSFSNPQGTTNLATDDHALQHRTAGSAIVALENKVGIGSGSAALNQILVGSGAGTAAWGTAWNNANLGTPAITGGTANNQILGTPAITGGTANAFNLGTPTITGGISLSVNGSITQAGAADHITLTPGASKLVKLAVLRQDGTTNTYKNNTIMQSGWFFLNSGNGTTVLSKSVTFGLPFTSAPVVTVSPVGVVNGSDPTSIGQLTTQLVQTAGACAITTTGFNAKIQDTTNFGTADRMGFAWCAIGDL
jgi:hypothetical protein